jgi:hypothetical protein
MDIANARALYNDKFPPGELESIDVVTTIDREDYYVASLVG